MNVGILIEITSEIGCGSGLITTEHATLGRREVRGHAVHLKSGFGQLRILFVGGNAVADEQKISIASRWKHGSRCQQSERTGGDDGGIFDPEMRFWFGNQEGFKIQVVQTTVGDDDDSGVVREVGLRQCDQYRIELATILAGEN